MIVYHGTHTDKLIPDKTVNSRYGFPALFFTENKRLATMYQTTSGSLFKAEIHPDKIIDFNGEISHSSRFRNLMYKLYREAKYGVVMIDNIYDRPDASYPLEKGIILIVFDFDKILNLQACI